MAFGGRARARGFMALPTAIAITSQNAIFVADFAGAAVHQYQLINTTAADSYGAPQPAAASPAPAAAPPTRDNLSTVPSPTR